MEVGKILASPAFQHFDKGLKARSPGDQLSAITSVTTLLKENPFPSLVNQVAVRLADVFKEGNNQLRTCIARVLADSSEHLSLIFSSEEVLKRIFVVTFSNDPMSRALTLEVLGSLAHLYRDSKKVHHLILESLTVENDFEFECATHAMVEYAKISPDFAAATVERLSALLTSSEFPGRRKILLIPAIGSMKSDVNATKASFALERFILDTSDSENLICAVLSAMTSLAKSTRYTIPEQTDILLLAAINADSRQYIRFISLTELEKLAKYAHVWEEVHLKKMRELKLKVENSTPIMMNMFLKILIRLSTHFRPNHLDFFEEILFELGYIFTADNVKLRIMTIQFACNVFVYKPDDILAKKLVDAFAVTTSADMKPNMAKRFFRTLTKFICSKSIDLRYVETLIGPLLDTDTCSPHFQLIVELFAAAANRIPQTTAFLNKWAVNRFQNLSNPEIFNKRSSEPFVFLLLAPGIEIDPSVITVAASSDWDKYTVARTALRNGHWKSAAAINLDNISTDHLSVVQKLWIAILRKLAHSQVTEFSYIALKEQRDILLSAKSEAMELNEFSSDPAFVFLNGLINSMLHLSSILAGFASGISFVSMFKDYAKNIGNLQRIRFAIDNFAKGLHKCESTWTELYQSSFTADSSTLDYLSFIHTSISLIYVGAMHLLNYDNIREILIPPLADDTTIALKSKLLLEWAKLQTDELGVLSEESFIKWMSIVQKLLTHPCSIPRLLFHQEYQCEIKLSISSVNEKGEITVPNNNLVPIQIDGFIHSNHPSKVDSVIVQADVHPITSLHRQENTSHTSSIKLNGETHFSTQMMFIFRQSCTMEFTIKFIDSQKRTWNSNSRNKIKVFTNE